MKDAVEVDEKLRTETPKLNQAFAKERICKAEFEGLKERMSKNVREVSTCRARQYALTKRGFELSELQYTQFKHLEKMQTVLSEFRTFVDRDVIKEHHKRMAAIDTPIDKAPAKKAKKSVSPATTLSSTKAQTLDSHSSKAYVTTKDTADDEEQEGLPKVEVKDEVKKEIKNEGS